MPAAPAEDPVTDTTGLEMAYSQGDTQAPGDTLRVAGVHNIRAVFDDATTVPFWGDARRAAWCKSAEKALDRKTNVKSVVGHSLGGAIPPELSFF